MNDLLAEQTIEDHKYLLEHIENKCAIAFFACINRNQSLYNAMQQYTLQHVQNDEKSENHSGDPLNEQFTGMMDKYDFMSIVMYPELRNRREFVHDCYVIAKSKENDELK
jgi:hypothetical protein